MTKALKTLFNETWEDFKTVYEKHCRYGDPGTYGWFFNEADIRFHFSRIFYQKLVKMYGKEDVFVFTDFPFDPKNYPKESGEYDESWEGEMEGIIKKAGRKKPFRIDLAASATSQQYDYVGEIFVEFKYFNSVKGISYYRKYRVTDETDENEIEQDIKRLSLIKKKELCRYAYMIVIDECPNDTKIENKRDDWKKKYPGIELWYYPTKEIIEKYPEKKGDHK